MVIAKDHRVQGGVQAGGDEQHPEGRVHGQGRVKVLIDNFTALIEASNKSKVTGPSSRKTVSGRKCVRKGSRSVAEQDCFQLKLSNVGGSLGLLEPGGNFKGIKRTLEHCDMKIRIKRTKLV